jgi:hypothetical protein
MRKYLPLIIGACSILIFAANSFATAASQNFAVDGTLVGDAGRAYLPGFPSLDPTLTANFLNQGAVTPDFGSGLDLNAQNALIGGETGSASSVVYEQPYNPVPEPGTLLLGAGAFGLACYGKRRQNG